mgnify:CR=1 FL=1
MNTSVTPSSLQEGISLSDGQRDDLIRSFVELQVDSMDMGTMLQIVSDNFTDYYEKCSDLELKEEVDNYDDELWVELVDNVKIDDIQLKRQHMEEIKYDREELS